MVFLTLTLPQAITVQSTSHIKARSDQRCTVYTRSVGNHTVKLESAVSLNFSTGSSLKTT